MIKKYMRSALLALAVIALPVVAQAQPVIIVFDVDRAIALSKAGKSMSKQLEEQVAKVRGDEAETVKKLQAEVDKLKEQQKLLAPDALQSKMAEIRQKEVERRQALAETTQSIKPAAKRQRSRSSRWLKRNSAPSPKSARRISSCAAMRCFSPARPLM